MNVPYIVWGYLNFPDMAYSVKLFNSNNETLSADILVLDDGNGYIFNLGNFDSQWAIGDQLYVREYNTTGSLIAEQKIFLVASPQYVPFSDLAVSVIEISPVNTININLQTTTSDFASEIIISEISDFSNSTWQTYEQVKGFDITPYAGNRYVYVKVRDLYKTESRTPSETITLSIGLPTNPSVKIVEGSQITSRDITLALFVDNPYEMVVSEDSLFSDVLWQPFQALIPFVLSSEIGNKIVYAKFRNLLYEESEVVFDVTYLMYNIRVPEKPIIIFPVDGNLLSNMPVFEFRNPERDGMLKYKVELSIDDFEVITVPYTYTSKYAVYDQEEQEYYFDRIYTSEPWKPKVYDWTWHDIDSDLLYIPSRFKKVEKEYDILQYSDLSNVTKTLKESMSEDDFTKVKSWYFTMDLDLLSDTDYTSELKTIEAWLKVNIKPYLTDEVIVWKTLTEIYDQYIEKEHGYIREHKLNTAFVLYINDLISYSNDVIFYATIEKLSALANVFKNLNLTMNICVEKTFADKCYTARSNVLNVLQSDGHNIETLANIPVNIVDESEKINYIVRRRDALNRLDLENNIGIAGEFVIHNWELVIPTLSFKYAHGYAIPVNYRYQAGDMWSSSNGFPGGTIAKFKVPEILELPPQTYQLRVLAFNGYGWSLPSDVVEFRIGRYLERSNEWDFVVRQQEAKVYWTDGVVVTMEDVLFLEGNIDINPALYPAPGVTATSNKEWWMVVKQLYDSNRLSLYNDCIKFCDKKELPKLMEANDGWIPVLFFQDGVRPRTPALPSTFVSTVANNLSIVDGRNLHDEFLSDHASDEAIHGINDQIFDLPLTLTEPVLVGDESLYTDISSLFHLISITPDSIGIKAQGWGVGLIGIDEDIDISEENLSGAGAFCKGSNADLYLKNGIISSKNGILSIGRDHRPMQLKIISRDKPGLIA